METKIKEFTIIQPKAEDVLVELQSREPNKSDIWIVYLCEIFHTGTCTPRNFSGGEGGGFHKGEVQ